jgi:hypothetical protein
VDRPTNQQTKKDTHEKRNPRKKTQTTIDHCVDPTTTMAEPAAKKETDKVGELFDVSLMSMEHVSIGFVYGILKTYDGITSS